MTNYVRTYIHRVHTVLSGYHWNPQHDVCTICRYLHDTHQPDNAHKHIPALTACFVSVQPICGASQPADPDLEVLCSLCKVLVKVANHCVKVSAPCKRFKGKGEMGEGQWEEGYRGEG